MLKQLVRKSRKMLKRKKMRRRTRRWTMRGRGWRLWQRRREATPPSKLGSGIRLLSATHEVMQAVQYNILNSLPNSTFRNAA